MLHCELKGLSGPRLFGGCGFEGGPEKTSLSAKTKRSACVGVVFGVSYPRGGNFCPHAWVLLRTIKRIRASDGCLGTERR